MNGRQRARRHDQAAIGSRANAAMARSISDASRTSSGHHLDAERRRARPGSRRTGRCRMATAGIAKRLPPVSRGGICLSSSSHFPLILYSNCVKPVTLPPGRARLSTKPGADRIGDQHEHDRHGAGRLQQSARYDGAVARDDVRRERNQFRRKSCCMPLGVACGPAVVDPQVGADRSSPSAAVPCSNTAPCGPALPDRPRRGAQHADPPHALALLRRAASGHAAAAPPSVNMNSRRRMWIAMRPSRRRSCACNRGDDITL